MEHLAISEAQITRIVDFLSLYYEKESKTAIEYLKKVKDFAKIANKQKSTYFFYISNFTKRNRRK